MGRKLSALAEHVSVFLKYISDAFEELYAKLNVDKPSGADPEDKDKAENVLFVLTVVRWSLSSSESHRYIAAGMMNSEWGGDNNVNEDNGYDA